MKKENTSEAALAPETPATPQPEEPVRPAPCREITLSTEREIKIIADPLRQRMLNQMEICGEPVTAKRLADLLGIAPSSAKHHLKQLESIGVVRVDHQATINGILATFYATVDAVIRLGPPPGQSNNQRVLLIENEIRMLQEEIRRQLDGMKPDTPEEEALWGTHFSAGVIRLTREETLELGQIIQRFVADHKDIRPGTAPIHFGILSYRAEEAKEDD